MKKIKKKGRHKGQFNNRLVAVTVTICLLCCTVSAGLLAQPVIVYASVGTSIKSLIVTLIAAIGIGNSNPSFTNALDQSQLLNSSYESLVDGSISAQALDQELSNLGVDVTNMTNVLGNTAEQAAAVSAADQAAQLGEIGAATAGENIAASAQHLSQYGEVAASIGGKAAGCLNGMGALMPIIWDRQIHSENVHKLEKLIANAQYYNNQEFLNSKIKPGINAIFTSSLASGGVYPTQDSFTVYYNAPVGCIFTFSEDGYIAVCNTTSSDASVSLVYGNNSTSRPGTVYAHNYREYDASPNPKYLAGFTTFTTRTDMLNYIATIKGTDQSNNVHSPDLIGTEGNQKGQWPSQNTYNFPDIKPIINITNNNPTEYITPIDYDDYKNWQQTANQNTQNGETGQEQGEDFQNLIRDFIRQWDGTVPVPTEAPAPTLSPVNPIVTPVPSIPVTPTPSPEEGAEIPKGFTTPELKDKFPFCIPYDIFLAFGLLTAQGEAPVFDWNITFGQYGTYNVHIDLSPWDPAARLLRILQLLLFIVCLAVGTRKLGGFGSGEE